MAGRQAAFGQPYSGIKGQFILSINDVPEIRQAFAGFKFQEVELTYSVAGGKGKPARELVVTSG